jgi:uncharacterized membrane protein
MASKVCLVTFLTFLILSSLTMFFIPWFYIMEIKECTENRLTLQHNNQLCYVDLSKDNFYIYSNLKKTEAAVSFLFPSSCFVRNYEHFEDLTYTSLQNLYVFMIIIMVFNALIVLIFLCKVLYFYLGLLIVYIRKYNDKLAEQKEVLLEGSIKILNEETLNEETLNKETLNEETLNKETLNEEI